MVKKETREFVNKNRDILRMIMDHGDPALRPIAAAFLACVPPEPKDVPKPEDLTNKWLKDLSFPNK